MRSSLFHSIAGSLAALALGFLVTTTPASAAFRMGGGGGFHGGGFHGGGFHGGYGGGYRGYGGWGWGGYGGWGWGDYYGDPYDAYYGYGRYGGPYPYAGDAGCVRPQRVYDRHGHYLGRRYVDMCR